MDYTKNTYTITKINKDLNTVTVTFDVDGTSQTLSGAPLDDAEGTKQFLSDYCNAYIAGLQQNSVTVDKDVTALVGKKQTADSEG